MNKLDLYPLADLLMLPLKHSDKTLTGSGLRAHRLGDLAFSTKLLVLSSYVAREQAMLIVKIAGNVGLLAGYTLLNGGNQTDVCVIDLSKAIDNGVNVLNVMQPPSFGVAVNLVAEAVQVRLTRLGRQPWQKVEPALAGG